MIAFELVLFWLKAFWSKWQKLVYFRVLLDTSTLRCRSARLGVELRLGGPETPSEKFMLLLGEPLCLGIALLRLGQATVPVLFFLRLILKSVTLLFGLSMEDN